MKFKRVVIPIILVIALLATSFLLPPMKNREDEIKSDRRTDISSANWYSIERYSNGQRLSGLETPRLLKVGESVTIKANTLTGKKNIILNYKPSNPKIADCIVNFEVDDKKFVCSLPLLWTDSKDEYSIDRYGNELYPKQICLEEYIANPLLDNSSKNKDTILIDLEEGSHTFTITAENQDLWISGLILTDPEVIPSYSEYQKQFKNKKTASGLYVAEGEKYSVKSDSYIRSKSVQNAALIPYDTYNNKINVLDGSTWDNAGQKVAWEIEVEEDGLYKLGMRYALNNNADKNSYRSLEIDGKIPFAECNKLAITSSGNGYENYVFSGNDGKPYEFYLEKGKHLISLKVEMGDLKDIYYQIQSKMEEINVLGASLQKLTAGVTDENRTWDMEDYMPGTVDKLLQYAKDIRKIYDNIKKISGNGASYASNLLYAAESLEKLAEAPEQIPNRTNLLSIGDSSASKYLSVVMSGLTSLPVTIDRIYLFNNTELPKASASLVRSLAEGTKSFISSFTSDGNKNYAADYDDDKELKVWINRPVQYVQVLQQILDEEYNAEKGTNIKLSIMPSEQKLILANVSGNNPDVVLSAAYSTPFNFAVRGAAKNLLSYDDFLSFYAENYNLEALIPLSYNGGVYGAIESQDFYCLFYRKDTLEALNLDVPNTWDDVRKMMPELLRNSMNFCVPVASAGGTKTFSVTAPFIYQNNGQIYRDDAMAVNYGTKNVIKGFTDMTELFSIYGAQQTVANFYNSFRYNTTPIGIGTFSTYLQLKVAAPELEGLWGIAMVPGTKQSDGTVQRYQMADSTASMIFANTKKPDEAWDFLKWYLSTDTQVNYANTLQSTYGSEYRLNTANLNAFKQLQYSEEDLKVILGQWEWQKENLQHPAGYMSERELSNAWINVVVNGDGIAEALDKAVLQSDREILRKMQEFGYCDEDGNIIKDYKLLTAKDFYAMLEEKEAAK
ncbi:MAG: extracellular solute-binding protein [Ruminococcaceae bacterium]|nr:extracellular solute-binding protein [Oscillospiraceae bacterium]